MDWKIILNSFLLIFLAEIGDKTQLVIVGLAAKEKMPLAVFLGAGAALVLATVLAVAFGEALTRLIPLHYIRYLAGLVFIVFGCLILVGK